MNRILVLASAAIARLGPSAGGIALAGGGGSTVKVKTGQPGKQLQLAQFRINGQIDTRRGGKQARFRCLGDRKIVVKGPPERPVENRTAEVGH